MTSRALPTSLRIPWTSYRHVSFPQPQMSTVRVSFPSVRGCILTHHPHLFPGRLLRHSPFATRIWNVQHAVLVDLTEQECLPSHSWLLATLPLSQGGLVTMLIDASWLPSYYYHLLLQSARNPGSDLVCFWYRGPPRHASLAVISRLVATPLQSLEQSRLRLCVPTILLDPKNCS
jgi:hypothetical protein